MPKFDIYEEGTKFASIEADCATEALKIAAAEHPRRAADYNLDPGDDGFEIEWYARIPDDTDDIYTGTAFISVPGTGTEGCSFDS